MAQGPARRHVLLISTHPQPTLSLLRDAAGADWGVLSTDSAAAAAALPRRQACDVILADESWLLQAGVEGLADLVRQESAPVVVLADASPASAAGAYACGVSL